jgi:excisionase family DNA binding protein
MNPQGTPSPPKKKPRTLLPRAAYTVKEFAEVTSLSKPTIYRMMEAGELAIVQIRATRRIPASELVRLGLASAA